MKIVQVSFAGGFGNQLFQYAAARRFAEYHGAVLEVGDWLGRKVFTGLDDPRPSIGLPFYEFEELPPTPGFRLRGYFQRSEDVRRLSHAKVRSWFTIQPEWLGMFHTPAPPYIAAHVRRGDYFKHAQILCVVSSASYAAAFRQYGVDPSQVVWVDQDRPRLVAGIPDEISFLPDFVTLMRAGILFRANSTFSWWAAALADAGQCVYSPVVAKQRGERDVPFVPGNHSRTVDGMWHSGMRMKPVNGDFVFGV